LGSAVFADRSEGDAVIQVVVRGSTVVSVGLAGPRPRHRGPGISVRELVTEGRAAARELIDGIEEELLGRGVSLQTLEGLAMAHRATGSLEERERASRARVLA
jgi:hypothetical protein